MEQPTLLILDDRCLIEIFRLLPINDVLNLAKTCVRLKTTAISAYTKAYRDVRIEIRVTKEPRSERTKEILLSWFSFIGGIVHNLSLTFVRHDDNKWMNANPFIYEILKKFPNLKELKLDSNAMPSQLTACFSINNPMEHLECWYEHGIFNQLKVLPNLTSLRIHKLPSLHWRNESFESLIRLKGLTKFSFSCINRYNHCNLFLAKLAKHLDLVELEISASVNDQTFSVINSFGNLKCLSINDYYEGSFPTPKVPENAVLPPKIDYLKLGGWILPCNSFLSIVRNLKQLTEFDIRDCFIYINNEDELFAERTYRPNYNKFTSRIATELRNELISDRRTLKLTYFDECNPGYKPTPLHNLDELKVVNRRSSDRIIKKGVTQLLRIRYTIPTRRN